ncbi:MAG: amino acid adenylation domain-containing protein, partial [Planctomycetes bacterium]|nr:amino acid adenylation domain-containing protein [Planctomycetota bacterium]
MEKEGELYYRWYVTDALFQQEFIHSLFAEYQKALKKAAQRVDTKACLSLAQEGKLFPLTNQQSAYAFGRNVHYKHGKKGCVSYNEFEIAGLDIEHFNRVWNQVVRCHPALRTMILSSGQQQVLDSTPEYLIQEKVVTTTEEEFEKACQTIREEMLKHVYSLDEYPYFSITNCSFLQQKSRIFMCIDLLIADGKSIAILYSQLFDGYFYSRSLPPCAYSFQEYVLYKEQQKQTAQYLMDSEYWNHKFSMIPSGPQRLEKSCSFRSSAKQCSAVFSHWQELQKKASLLEVSTHAILLTIYGEILLEWNANLPCSIVVVHWDRDSGIHPEINSVVGDFTRLSWISFEVSNKPLEEKITIVQQQMDEDYHHRAADGIEKLRKYNNLFFPVVFTTMLEELGSSESRYNSMLKNVYSISHTPQVILDLIFTVLNPSEIKIQWDTSIDDQGKEEIFLEKYCGKLKKLVLDSQNTNQKSERKETLPQRSCLHHIFEGIAKSHPNLCAVQYQEESITYEELEKASRACALWLLKNGAKPDMVIGVHMDRSIELVVALLGILRSGAAYLPIDVNFPETRIRYIVKEANLKYLLIQKQFQFLEKSYPELEFVYVENFLKTKEDQLTFLPQPEVTVNHLAYVIYTSGSTGNPKGCMIEHRCIMNRLLWMQSRFSLTKGDSVLQKTPYSFDVSVWEFFWPLMYGSRIVMAKAKGHLDIEYLLDLINRENISVCHFVPSMLRKVLQAKNLERMSKIRRVIVSGEALEYDLLEEFDQKISIPLENLYGPTEASIDVTHWSCQKNPEGKTYLGKAIEGISLRILDDSLRPVQDGEIGQLWIEGIGVGRGYLNQPELTAQSFFKNPLNPSVRLYKTGDLVSLEAGNFLFHGRVDSQVKFNGLRIELEEIEQKLRFHPLIEDALVAIQEFRSQKVLAAHLVCKDTSIIKQEKELRAFLQNSLPNSMIPNVWRTIDEIPVTTHGKRNRKDLPPLSITTKEKKLDFQESSELENPPIRMVESNPSILDRLFSCVRDCDIHGSLDPKQDLFEQGLTSLTVLQLVQKVKEEFGVVIDNIEEFLGQPNLYFLSELIAKELPPYLSKSEAEEKKLQMGLEQEDGFREVAVMEKVVKLQEVNFKKVAYTQGAIRRDFKDKVMTLKVFSQFLSTLRQETVKRETKYLYPSSGGLNAVQVYIYIKEKGVESVKEGIYYYHPEEHGLYLIGTGQQIGGEIFFEYDRPVFNHASFALFLIAQLEAITPIYQAASPILVTLDAGYMGQLMLSSQADLDLGLCPVTGVDFEKVRNFFKLDESHRFLHCILGGVCGQNLQEFENGIIDYLSEMGQDRIEDYQNYFDKTFTSFLMADPTKVLKTKKFLTNEEHQKFHEKKLNIRRFIKNDVFIKLDTHIFEESAYQLRSSKRQYLDKPVTFNQFSKFLSLLKPEDIEGQTRYLYPSITGTYGVQTYLYIKENGVEGLDEGIYYYNPIRHALFLITSKPSQIIKESYTSFNKIHYRQAKFCLFLIGQPTTMQPLNKGEMLYFALLEAGYIGQLLMDKQAEFEMGICPIGGIHFNRIRSDFNLEEESELLHSFTCGGYELEIPKEHKFLKINREEKTENRSDGLCSNIRMNSGKDIYSEDIAIIGIHGQFPGARNLDEFWRNLLNQEMSFSSLPEKRRNQLCDKNGNGSKVWGGFLDSVHEFDPMFFNILPAVAKLIDPQERLFLMCVHELLELSGYQGHHLQQLNSKMGVFVGVMWNDMQSTTDEYMYQNELLAHSCFSSIANRVSHYFDWIGPSLSIDTSCASSLTSIALACQSIQKGECQIAVAGGVNLVTHLSHLESLWRFQLLSKEKESYTFGERASGWIPGEGVGALLLKPLSQAELDYDAIWGVIKGSSLAYGGKTARYGMPSTDRQRQVMIQAMNDANITSDAIDYVEASAAGSAMGDASEIKAIQAVFSGKQESLVVGTVKSNIGHLESAAGVSQFAKLILQMKHQKIAPVIPYQKVNPLINLQKSNLEIVTQVKEWIADKNRPLTALVNGFGGTGSYASLVVQSYHDAREIKNSQKFPPVFVISAKTPIQLK